MIFRTGSLYQYTEKKILAISVEEITRCWTTKYRNLNTVDIVGIRGTDDFLEYSANKHKISIRAVQSKPKNEYSANEVKE
jgi:hypothetical protein